MPIVKRYPNRKLYDTEAKRYVTLEELTLMIRTGNDVQVIDHESGDDLTTLTLTQIILEQEKKSTDGFLPRSLLTSLIRTGGDTLEQLLRTVQIGPLRAGGDGASDSQADGDSQEEAEPLGTDQGEGEVTVGQEMTDGETSPDDWQEDLLHMFKMPSQRDLQDLRVQLAILNERLDEVLDNKGRDAGDTIVGDMAVGDTVVSDTPDESVSSSETT